MKKIITNLSNDFREMAIEHAYITSAIIYWGDNLNIEYCLPSTHELADIIMDRLVERYIDDLLTEIRCRLAINYREEELDEFFKRDDLLMDFREGVVRYCID